MAPISDGLLTVAPSAWEKYGYLTTQYDHSWFLIVDSIWQSYLSATVKFLFSKLTRDDRLETLLFSLLFNGNRF